MAILAKNDTGLGTILAGGKSVQEDRPKDLLGLGRAVCRSSTGRRQGDPSP